jgi:hypothetical protein
MFASSLPLSASAGGRCVRAALAAPPARGGSPLQGSAAGRGAARRGLDRRLRRRHAEGAEVVRCEGLRAGRREKLGGTISKRHFSHEGAQYAAAAPTSPLGSRWRGRRRTRRVLGDNGPGHWEVARQRCLCQHQDGDGARMGGTANSCRRGVPDARPVGAPPNRSWVRRRRSGPVRSRLDGASTCDTP